MEEKNPASVRASARRYEAKPETRAMKHAYYLANKEHWMEQSIARRAAKPSMRREEYERYKANDPTGLRRRDQSLKAKYGLSLVEYNRLFAAQGGVCAIYASPPLADRGKGKCLDVDHDHQTGVVRGLLCRRCNALVDYFDKTPPHVIESARAYIFSRRETTLTLVS